MGQDGLPECACACTCFRGWDAVCAARACVFRFCFITVITIEITRWKDRIPSPPASPAPGSSGTYEGAAALASQTLLGKLGSAFWKAFSGSDPNSDPGPHGGMVRKEWDAEKVRKVLEGRVVVRVVDVEPHAGNSSSSIVEKVSTPSMAEKKPVTGPGVCKANMCDILEESMRSLTISKK